MNRPEGSVHSHAPLRRRRLLKALRVAVACVFFLGFAAIFCDYLGALPQWIKYGLPQTQFGPGIMEFLTGHYEIAWLLILVLTFLFGRIYCSFACPLGIFQDLIWHVSSKLRPGKWLRFSKEKPVWRYGILLAVVLGVVLGGSAMALVALDPDSMWGRTCSVLFRPLLSWVHNGVALLGEATGWFSIYTHVISLREWSLSLAVLGMLVLIVLMSVYRGRAYCNTICPVGTLLGCASRVSMWRMQIDKSLCVKCGKCLKSCKAACIDLKNGTVDASRCVMCMNCVAQCDEHAISLVRVGRKEAPALHKEGRRRFLGDSAMIAGAVGAGFLGRLFPAASAEREEQQVACPPGAGSLDSFLNACTACALCVSECPGGVLVPSFFAYGKVEGFLRPRMDFHSGFCTFDCNECGRVCPTGAIRELSLEEKKQVQIGRVEFERSLCVVESDLTACGACAEHCPTQAVRMLPFTPSRTGKDGETVTGLTLPDIREDLCIGCGACEYACPVRPLRAISVRGLAVHGTAKIVEEESLPPPPDGFAF